MAGAMLIGAQVSPEDFETIVSYVSTHLGPAVAPNHNDALRRRIARPATTALGPPSIRLRRQVGI